MRLPYVMVYYMGTVTQRKARGPPGVAVRLAEQECEKLRVKDLQEVAGHQVTHGAYNEASPLGWG